MAEKGVIFSAGSRAEVWVQCLQLCLYPSGMPGTNVIDNSGRPALASGAGPRLQATISRTDAAVTVNLRKRFPPSTEFVSIRPVTKSVR